MKKIIFSYLKFWTKIYLGRTKPEIIAITGSVGKTSTKEAVFAVLREKFGADVEKSYGNLNTEIGVPLAVLGYKKSPTNFLVWLKVFIAAAFRALSRSSKKILIIEFGIDNPGDIKYLTSFIHPKIAILTSIGISHFQAFGSMEKITEEKADLIRALDPIDSWAILNIDDERIRKISYANRYQKKTFALEQPADFTAKNIKVSLAESKPETTFEINFGKNKISINQSTLGGKSSAYAALAATAIGEIYRLTPAEIKAGLDKVLPEAHRLNVLKGKSDSIIIDDCYNASPVSMKLSFDILNQISGGKKKIAVLGDMLELGKVARQSHLEIGALAKKLTNEQIAIGNLAKIYGFKKYFRHLGTATDYLLKNMSKNDIILIKASRKIGLEKLVEALKE